MILFWKIFLLATLPLLSAGTAQTVYLTQSGQINFRSDAPLELIEASSDKLRGAIDTEANTFAFSVEIASFEGFNSPLQQVHFNENYLETKRFPTATFSGKIIEKVDLTQPGEYVLRAKGKLTVHGVTRERIIKSTVRVVGKQLHLHSDFTVLLEEHDVSIPKIVHQKIAEEIAVQIKAVLDLTEK